LLYLSFSFFLSFLFFSIWRENNTIEQIKIHTKQCFCFEY
jgi:hypothetical protein